MSCLQQAKCVQEHGLPYQMPGSKSQPRSLCLKDGNDNSICLCKEIKYGKPSVPTRASFNLSKADIQTTHVHFLRLLEATTANWTA